MNFYNVTWGLVDTILQPLINWPLSRGYFGTCTCTCSLGCTLLAVAIVERWPLYTERLK